MQEAETPEPATDNAGDVSSLDSAFVERLRNRSDRGVDYRDGRIADLQTELKALQQQKRELQAISSMLTDLSLALRSGQVGTALDLVRRSGAGQKALKEQQPGEWADLEAHTGKWEEELDEILKSTARSFPAALAQHDLHPDSSSRDPRYTLGGGFVTIEFDKKKRTARVQTRGGKRRSLPPDPSVVAERVAQEYRRCFERNVDLAELAKRVRLAYRSCVEGEPGRDSVPVLEVVEAMKADDDNFELDEFIVDLAKLVATGQQGPTEAAGMKLDHTKDSDKGILLPGLESNGYYGYVKFNEQARQGGDRNDQ